jgi:hypothetical protein
MLVSVASVRSLKLCDKCYTFIRFNFVLVPLWPMWFVIVAYMCLDSYGLYLF